MRYKIVPEPRSIERLRAAADAVPLVPGSVEDCCTRIRDETDVASRDEARELLTFLQALGLVAESERGFHRVRDDRSRAELVAAFRKRVFGAEEILTALEERTGKPQDSDQVFEFLRASVPQWERDRHTDWEAEWRERTARLLEWSVRLGLAERAEGGYRSAGEAH
ncbi:MAG: hypothetical protein ABEH35_08200 [Haloarculaceae archaeon]